MTINPPSPGDQTGLSGLWACLLLEIDVLAANTLFDLPAWTLLFGAAFAAAGLPIHRARKAICVVAKGLVPFGAGVLAFLIYRAIHQDGHDFAIGSVLSGRDLSELIKNAGFNVNYKEPFYTAMATLFAIVVGLALVEGIEAVQKVRESITQETYKIRSIVHFLSYFEDDELIRYGSHKVLQAKLELIGCLRRYADLVGSRKDVPGSPDAEKAGLVLDECQRVVLRLTPFDDDDRIAQRHIVSLLQEIGLARLKRITFVGEMPPKYMMFALWLMCGALVLPFFAEPLCVEPGDYRAEIAETARGDTIVAHIRAQQQLKCGATLVPNKLRYSQYYMIFVIVSFFSFIMLMLHDVGDTSEGFWRLEFKEFSDLLPELSELEARERQVLEEAPTMKTATYAFTPIWCPVA